MKTRILLSVMAFGLIVSAFSQKATMELTFTAQQDGQHVPLNSILIENLTQGGDTTLFAPDTVLVLEYSPVGISDNKAIEGNSFSVSQNYPNPFEGKTEVNLYLPETEDIKISVRDILGRELAQYKSSLKQGNHSFAFYAGNEKYYLLSVTGKQTSKTIKMLNANSGTISGGKCKLVYNNHDMNGFKSHTAINDFVFEIEDELQYTAYTDVGETSIIDTPIGDQTYTFQYVEWPICPGYPTVTDIDGNIYNTVLIGDQCWMKENLKTTTYNDSTPIPNVTNDDEWNDLTTGAYAWYDNDISWKDLYGALYNGHSVGEPGGLCPTGWHVPTKVELSILAVFVGGLSSPSGNKLKSCRQVNSPIGGNCDTDEHPRWEEHSTHYGTDDYGFSALPGSSRTFSGSFSNIGNYFFIWSSTEYYTYYLWLMAIYNDNGNIDHFSHGKKTGYSVRCLQD